MNSLPAGFGAGCHERMAIRLGALAHPVRVAILHHLANSPSCCCKDVVGCFDLAQSTVSQHLRVLTGAGLVKVKQERQMSLYQLDAEALMETARELSSLAESCAPGRCAGNAKDEGTGAA
jgi:ArsR family transcriptional regulator